MIKNILLLGILLAVSGFSQAQMATPSDATDCSQMFFKALLEEDTKALESLLAFDFTVTSFDGQQIDRQTLLQAIQEGYLSVDSGMLSGLRTRNYGDVGVVTGRWNANGLVQNMRFTQELSCMVVAVKVGGHWKVSAVQLTPIL